MEKKQNNKNRLSEAEIEEFKAILLAKRNEILGDVSSMELEALRRDRTDLSSLPIHMADLGTDNYDIENTLGLMDSERKILTEINDALVRIDDGNYGICEGSGKLIPKARLEAIPWAKYCVEYANMLEKGLVRGQAFSTDTSYDYSDDDQDENPGKSFRRKAV